MMVEGHSELIGKKIIIYKGEGKMTMVFGGRYEVWSDGLRVGRLICKTNDINEAIEQKGNNQGSFLIDTENVNYQAVVVNKDGKLRSHEKVIIVELKDGNLAIVEDLAGNLHRTNLDNLRL
jgi:hypothetical protein